MNKDVFKGKWKQIRGDMKKLWGELTNDDIDKIEGDRDKLVGLVQERYGYARDQAEREVNQRLSTYR